MNNKTATFFIDGLRSGEMGIARLALPGILPGHCFLNRDRR
jgi:hypothetical protein